MPQMQISLLEPTKTKPSIGDVRKGWQIGKDPNSKFIWQACATCGKERWIRLNASQLLCPRCAAKKRNKKGDRHWNWRGGKGMSHGYVILWISPSDFFFPMADSNGRVREHRLVMAKHLKRCLLPWEVVHHKNGIKTDNRLENLQLIPCNTGHNTRLQLVIRKLQRENTKLRNILKIAKEQK